MEKKTYSFAYSKTKSNYISYYKDGAWDEGKLQVTDQITISAMSTSLHYGQEAFEGMKAYRRKDGRVQLFRPTDNAKRFQMSCTRMMMPIVSEEKFLDAVVQTVKDNVDFVPPYGSNATLYIRPYMIGIGDNLGLRPAPEYIFGVIVAPVGTYFGGIGKPVDFLVSDYDRAAPYGTGHVKVGGNYAASLYPQYYAKQKGYADCIFLDPKTHTRIEEVGAANFFAITKDNQYITPKSPSILKSITNQSLMYLAKYHLKLEVLEEDVYIDKLDHLAEAGACGTAAIITPLASITHGEKKHVFPANENIGEKTKQLYDLLTGIQFGDVEDPNYWTMIVE
ncbi:MAG: branched-chain amino acid aminotransferase [Acholeplasmataceae bacterium]|nr:branched-chain amino acid aminotransferase [Acholeplasmataceae bacterium]